MASQIPSITILNKPVPVVNDASIGIHLGQSKFKVARWNVENAEVIKDLDLNQKAESQNFNPQTIISIVNLVKEATEDLLDESVKHCVVTVPTTLSSDQIEHIESLAPEEVNYKAIEEPVAVAIAYNFDSSSGEKQKNILIFDFGSSSLDVSLVSVDKDVYQNKATQSQSFSDEEKNSFNSKLEQFCVDEFKSQTGVDISNDKNACLKLAE